MPFRVTSISLGKYEGPYDTYRQAKEKADEINSQLPDKGFPPDATIEHILPARTHAIVERGKQSPKRGPRSVGAGNSVPKKNRKRNYRKTGSK